MKKKNMKWKKSETIKNKNMAYSFWFIGKDTTINITNRSLKWCYYMQKRCCGNH